MSDLTFAANLVAKSFDTNKNGQVQDDVTFTPAALAKVDSDKNGQVSVAELTAAIETDSIVISGGAASIPKGKVTVPNILGASDALDNANTAVLTAQAPIQSLAGHNVTGMRNQIRARNGQIETSSSLYRRAINMSYDKDATFYQCVNGIKSNDSKVRANNQVEAQLGNINPGAATAVLQSSARQIYDIGVSMSKLTKSSSKSEVAQLKARLQVATNTVAAAGTEAQGSVDLIKNFNVQ
ncbi:MAG: hypothetical protein H7338_24920 [Candidatus Sericytochromatia bacterium]|nr:hypothetical protein [Candidatus Sericytochromatia bacterium]